MKPSGNKGNGSLLGFFAPKAKPSGSPAAAAAPAPAAAAAAPAPEPAPPSAAQSSAVQPAPVTTKVAAIDLEASIVDLSDTVSPAKAVAVSASQFGGAPQARAAVASPTPKQQASSYGIMNRTNAGATSSGVSVSAAAPAPPAASPTSPPAPSRWSLPDFPERGHQHIGYEAPQYAPVNYVEDVLELGADAAADATVPRLALTLRPSPALTQKRGGEGARSGSTGSGSHPRPVPVFVSRLEAALSAGAPAASASEGARRRTIRLRFQPTRVAAAVVSRVVETSAYWGKVTNYLTGLYTAGGSAGSFEAAALSGWEASLLRRWRAEAPSTSNASEAAALEVLAAAAMLGVGGSDAAAGLSRVSSSSDASGVTPAGIRALLHTAMLTRWGDGSTAVGAGGTGNSNSSSNSSGDSPCAGPTVLVESSLLQEGASAAVSVRASDLSSSLFAQPQAAPAGASNAAAAATTSVCLDLSKESADLSLSSSSSSSSPAALPLPANIPEAAIPCLPWSQLYRPAHPALLAGSSHNDAVFKVMFEWLVRWRAATVLVDDAATAHISAAALGLGSRGSGRGGSGGGDEGSGPWDALLAAFKPPVAEAAKSSDDEEEGPLAGTVRWQPPATGNERAAKRGRSSTSSRSRGGNRASSSSSDGFSDEEEDDSDGGSESSTGGRGRRRGSKKLQKKKKRDGEGEQSAFAARAAAQAKARNALVTCAMLVGPSGSGKTAGVHSCASALGFSVLEVNASQSRSKKALMDAVGEATKSRRLNLSVLASLGQPASSPEATGSRSAVGADGSAAAPTPAAAPAPPKGIGAFFGKAGAAKATPAPANSSTSSATKAATPAPAPAATPAPSPAPAPPRGITAFFTASKAAPKAAAPQVEAAAPAVSTTRASSAGPVLVSDAPKAEAVVAEAAAAPAEGSKASAAAEKGSKGKAKAAPAAPSMLITSMFAKKAPAPAPAPAAAVTLGDDGEVAVEDVTPEPRGRNPAKAAAVPAPSPQRAASAPAPGAKSSSRQRLVAPEVMAPALDAGKVMLERLQGFQAKAEILPGSSAAKVATAARGTAAGDVPASALALPKEEWEAVTEAGSAEDALVSVSAAAGTLASASGAALGGAPGAPSAATGAWGRTSGTERVTVLVIEDADVIFTGWGVRAEEPAAASAFAGWGAQGGSGGGAAAGANGATEGGTGAGGATAGASGGVGESGGGGGPGLEGAKAKAQAPIPAASVPALPDIEVATLDKGYLATLKEIIAVAKCPVVLVCSSFPVGRGEYTALADLLCDVHVLTPVHPMRLALSLEAVAYAEGLVAVPGAAAYAAPSAVWTPAQMTRRAIRLAAACGGDLRRALNQLQMQACGALAASKGLEKQAAAPSASSGWEKVFLPPAAVEPTAEAVKKAAAAVTKVLDAVQAAVDASQGVAAAAGLQADLLPVPDAAGASGVVDLLLPGPEDPQPAPASSVPSAAALLRARRNAVVVSDGDSSEGSSGGELTVVAPRAGAASTTHIDLSDADEDEGDIVVGGAAASSESDEIDEVEGVEEDASSADSSGEGSDEEESDKEGADSDEEGEEEEAEAAETAASASVLEVGEGPSVVIEAVDDVTPPEEPSAAPEAAAPAPEDAAPAAAEPAAPAPEPTGRPRRAAAARAAERLSAVAALESKSSASAAAWATLFGGRGESPAPKKKKKKAAKKGKKGTAGAKKKGGSRADDDDDDRLAGSKRGRPRSASAKRPAAKRRKRGGDGDVWLVDDDDSDFYDEDVRKVKGKKGGKKAGKKGSGKDAPADESEVEEMRLLDTVLRLRQEAHELLTAAAPVVRVSAPALVPGMRLPPSHASTAAAQPAAPVLVSDDDEKEVDPAPAPAPRPAPELPVPVVASVSPSILYVPGQEAQPPSSGADEQGAAAPLPGVLRLAIYGRHFKTAAGGDPAALRVAIAGIPCSQITINSDACITVSVPVDALRSRVTACREGRHLAGEAEDAAAPATSGLLVKDVITTKAGRPQGIVVIMGDVCVASTARHMAAAPPPAPNRLLTLVDAPPAVAGTAPLQLLSKNVLARMMRGQVTSLFKTSSAASAAPVNSIAAALAAAAEGGGLSDDEADGNDATAPAASKRGAAAPATAAPAAPRARLRREVDEPLTEEEESEGEGSKAATKAPAAPRSSGRRRLAVVMEDDEEDVGSGAASAAAEPAAAVQTEADVDVDDVEDGEGDDAECLPGVDAAALAAAAAAQPSPDTCCFRWLQAQVANWKEPACEAPAVVAAAATAPDPMADDGDDEEGSSGLRLVPRLAFLTAEAAAAAAPPPDVVAADTAELAGMVATLSLLSSCDVLLASLNDAAGSASGLRGAGNGAAPRAAAPALSHPLLLATREGPAYNMGARWGVHTGALPFAPEWLPGGATAAPLGLGLGSGEPIPAGAALRVIAGGIAGEASLELLAEDDAEAGKAHAGPAALAARAASALFESSPFATGLGGGLAASGTASLSTPEAGDPFGAAAISRVRGVPAAVGAEAAAAANGTMARALTKAAVAGLGSVWASFKAAPTSPAAEKAEETAAEDAAEEKAAEDGAAEGLADPLAQADDVAPLAGYGWSGLGPLFQGAAPAAVTMAWRREAVEAALLAHVEAASASSARYRTGAVTALQAETSLLAVLAATGGLQALRRYVGASAGALLRLVSPPAAWHGVAAPLMAQGPAGATGGAATMASGSVASAGQAARASATVAMDALDRLGLLRHARACDEAAAAAHAAGEAARGDRRRRRNSRYDRPPPAYTEEALGLEPCALWAPALGSGGDAWRLS